MGRARIVGVMMVMGLFAMTAPVHAQGRPIKQLPSDLLRWSMSWTKIPQGMVEAGQEYGPAAAVTVGPVQGAASMVTDTSKELWEIMKASKHAPRSAYAPRRSTGTALVRYEF